MNTQVAKLENVIIRGDLSHMSDIERVKYVKDVCESIGLNPLTQPFEYVKLSGKLKLYAKRDAADQLRQLHGVSISIAKEFESEGSYTVKVMAKNRQGRLDEDIGVVDIGGLRGEKRANAIMRCITKAKRRVTLSICGLGFLDETEVNDISEADQIKYELDEMFPESGKNDAIAGPHSDNSDAVDTDTSKNIDVVVTEDMDDAEGIPLFFLERHDQNQIIFTDSVAWVDEYTLQMKQIANDSEMPPKTRMPDLKEFEQKNDRGLSMLPDGTITNLLKRRQTANRKLGVIKNEK